MSELESRLTRSLTIAKQGLDILADQLVALGALNGRSSPNKKNPLAGSCANACCGQKRRLASVLVLVGSVTLAGSKRTCLCATVPSNGIGLQGLHPEMPTFLK
jgi:hypothetical protein